MLALIFRCLVALIFTSVMAAFATHLLAEVFDWGAGVRFIVAFVFAVPFSMTIGFYFAAEVVDRRDF